MEFLFICLLALCYAGAGIAFGKFNGFDPIGELREKNLEEKYAKRYQRQDKDDDEWSL